MNDIERTAGEVARLLGDMRGERWTVAEGWHDWQRRLHGPYGERYDEAGTAMVRLQAGEFELFPARIIAQALVIRGGADMSGTATLDLGRSTPATPKQRESARAGIAACNADWRDKALTTHDDMLRQGRDRYWRAGYELRWLELVPTLITHADLADLARWEDDGGA